MSAASQASPLELGAKATLSDIRGWVNEERIEEQNHDSVKMDAGGNKVSAMGSRSLELSA